MNIEHPLISVIMSVFKEPLEWVSQSIESILDQTYSNFEFIIINDNPLDDNLNKFLNDYQERDNRIVLIRNSENIGLTKSLNRGLKISTGKYIARMDADDISYPNRLEKQVEYMESHPDVIVCGTQIKTFGQKNYLSYNCIFEEDEDIRGQMLINSGVAHPSVIIRSRVMLKNNIKYDETFKTAQDYKLWYDLSHHGKFANLKEKLLKYRISSTQITSVNKENQSLNREQIRSLIKKEYITNFERLNNRSLKKAKSYLLREKVYYSQSFRPLCKFLANFNTATTTKEKVILTFLHLKYLFNRRLTFK